MADVAFHAHVEPPHESSDATPEPPPSPVRTTVESKCCPVADFTLPHTDPLLEALPTILVGIGIAWAVGVATGAILFTVPEPRIFSVSE